MKTQTFNQERLMQVILAPQVSEKATYVAEKHNHIIFRVLRDATKNEVKAAVELIWKAQNIPFLVFSSSAAGAWGSGRRLNGVCCLLFL